MSSSTRAAALRVGAVVIQVLLVAGLGGATAIYRFNTLGGTYGGLENDHFVPFAYAKQVEAGAQPLRDFAGLGLQGAWPSLTYEASALAQRWLGGTLRSEVVLSVAGVAIAAAVTFLAASLVANTAWALLATLLSVIVAPTLYNYPKVLMFSLGCLAIVHYARRPGVPAVAAGAVVTATAFLFRHDYAVYVGIGVLAVCVTARHRDAPRHAAAFIGLTVLLLAPSLVYVQYYAGLVDYLRDGLELSRREADRTNLAAWPGFNFHPVPGRGLTLRRFFEFEPNSVAWLYFLARLTPLVALIALKPDRDPGRPATRAAMLAVAVMFACATPFLVRGNIGTRLGDVGPMLAVLIAAVAHTLTRRPAAGWRWWQIPATVLVLAVAVGTALSARTVGYLENQLRVAGLSESWAVTRQRTGEVWAQLGDLPAAALTASDGPASLALARYLNRCTAPDDRVALMTYHPEILPFAGRLFAAGRLSIVPGYVLGQRQQAALVAQWRRERVPIALVEYSEFSDPASPAAPLVRDYLLAYYRRAGRVETASRPLDVFVRRDRRVVSTYPLEALPCLR
jgi:hypothetical protein